MTTPTARRHVNVELLNRLRDVLGGTRVSHGTLDGISYSRDLWPRGTLGVRRGRIENRPELIAWPETTEEVSRILRICNEMRVPVVPFGAGSGMCGAAVPRRGGIVLDLKRMKQVERISDQSNLVVCQPGILGAHLERELNRHGYTLGHLPGSLGTSTVGGYLATRSAGLAATYYGKIEDMVISLQVVLPDGTVVTTRTAPRRATGPDFNHLFLGSEGALGVITRTHLRIHLLPEAYFFRGLAFKNLAAGLESLRLILRCGLRPLFVRLCDEDDTATTMNELGIAVRGCLLVLIFGGGAGLVELSGRKAVEICRGLDGRDHGEEPARVWYEHRYAEHYRQSEILAEPETIFDTIDVAATWRDVEGVYRAVRSAVPKEIRLAAHVPHAYPEGCSLEFTMTGRAKAKKDLELYDRAWALVLDALGKNGGVLSHHHGIGLQKDKWRARQQPVAEALLRALKRQLDPYDILNPGKFDGEPEDAC